MQHLRDIIVSGTYLAMMCGVAIADCFFIPFRLVCIVMWGLYINHSSSTEEHMCNVTSIFVEGHMPKNVKCIYICVPGHIVECIGFIRGIYTYIVVSYVHMNLLAHVAYM